MQPITLMHKFAVYVDYTNEDPPRPFYVGKGVQSRVNNPRRNELHEYITRHNGCQRKIVFETDDEQLALVLEQILIAQFKTYESWGANLTPGGETSPMKDPLIAAKVSRSKLGHFTSEETKRKISESVRRIQARPDVKRKMSEASASRRHSLETRAKMSRSQKNRAPISEETRERIRLAALHRYRQPSVPVAVASSSTGSTSEVNK